LDLCERHNTAQGNKGNGGSNHRCEKVIGEGRRNSSEQKEQMGEEKRVLKERKKSRETEREVIQRSQSDMDEREQAKSSERSSQKKEVEEKGKKIKMDLERARRSEKRKMRESVEEPVVMDGDETVGDENDINIKASGGNEDAATCGNKKEGKQQKGSEKRKRKPKL